jgi:nicotinate-nucleotide adenylyltransferase
MTPGAMKRFGILGGTFDPIHCGHLDAASAAEAALGLTELLVVTSNVPPHRPSPAASSYHRFAMVSLAVAGRPGWRASDLELRDTARSYTSTTLQKLHGQGFAPAELYFIIGADAFADIMSWVDYPAILDYANFAVVARPGYRIAEAPQRLPTLAGRMVRLPVDSSRHDPSIILLDAPTSDVSSTAIRERRLRGESIAGLVPDSVRQHIEQHELYSSTTPERRESDASPAPAAGRLHG